MTTIKSNHYDDHFLDLPDTDAGETWLVVRQVDAIGQSGARMLGVTVKTADLLAALDATANTDVKHRADAYEDATRAEQERDEYRLKAVALAAERDTLNDELEITRESWETLSAELEKAEAKVAAVAKISQDMRTWGWQQKVHDWGEKLDDALADKPAEKQIILTADMPGVQVNGYDFIKGVLTKLPAADADRLIGAGLAKDAS